MEGCSRKGHKRSDEQPSASCTNGMIAYMDDVIGESLAVRMVPFYGDRRGVRSMLSFAFLEIKRLRALLGEENSKNSKYTDEAED